MKLRRAVPSEEVLKGVRSLASQTWERQRISNCDRGACRAELAVEVYFTVEKVAPIISRINLGLLALSWSIRDITSGNYIGCEI